MGDQQRQLDVGDATLQLQQGGDVVQRASGCLAAPWQVWLGVDRDQEWCHAGLPVQTIDGDVAVVLVADDELSGGASVQLVVEQFFDRFLGGGRSINDKKARALRTSTLD